MKKDEIYFAFNPQMASLILDIDLELPGFIFGLKKRRIIQKAFLITINEAPRRFLCRSCYTLFRSFFDALPCIEGSNDRPL